MWTRRKSSAVPTSLVLLAVTVAGHLAYMHLGYRELRPYTSYYFAPEVVFVVLTGCTAVKMALAGRGATSEALTFSRRSTVALLGMTAAFTSLLCYRSLDVPQSAFWEQRLEMAHDIDRLVPADATVSAFWPGMFAEFARRPVAPLDGIIGSRSYLRDYVKPERQIDYMTAQGSTYLVVFLRQSVDSFLEGPEPELSSLAVLGEVRLWQNRHLVENTVSYRAIDSDGSGWYLLELATNPGE